MLPISVLLRSTPSCQSCGAASLFQNILISDEVTLISLFLFYHNVLKKNIRFS